MSDTPEGDNIDPATTAPISPAEPPATLESGDLHGATPEGDDLADSGRKAIDGERRARRDAERELKLAKQELLQRERRDVAADRGLPAQLADRLVGSTRAELEADAEALADALKPAGRPRLPRSALLNPMSDGPATNAAAIADAIRRRT